MRNKRYFNNKKRRGDSQSRYSEYFNSSPLTACISELAGVYAKDFSSICATSKNPKL